MNLHEQAKQENNKELARFVERLGIFAILQSGVQLSPITYTKILPIEVYAKITEDILHRFTAEGYEIDPNLIWKQFHQNNWQNSAIVPRVKRYSASASGLIGISGTFRNAQYEFIHTAARKPQYQGKDNKEAEELIKQKKWDELMDYKLYQRIPFVGLEGEDMSLEQPTVWYRPINRLGNKMYMTEAYALDKGTIIQSNQPFDESTLDQAADEAYTSKSEFSGEPATDLTDALKEIDCSGGH
jgi:hypothetical protein